MKRKRTLGSSQKKRIIAEIEGTAGKDRLAKAAKSSSYSFTVTGTRVFPPYLIVENGDLVVWFNKGGAKIRVELPDKLGVWERHGADAFLRIDAKKGEYDYWVYSGSTRCVANSDPRIIVR